MGKSGKYEVELWYACREEDLGAEIELSFSGNSLVTTISTSNDPPLVGKQEDRAPRMESYVKDFKPMKMGVIEFKEGKGILKLQATQIPKSQAMEFRLLQLNRVKEKGTD